MKSLQETNGSQVSGSVQIARDLVEHFDFGSVVLDLCLDLSRDAMSVKL